MTKPTDWPNGYGQLTTRGMNMHYNVGRYFRQHYIDQLKFIDSEFNFKQVWVVATLSLCWSSCRSCWSPQQLLSTVVVCCQQLI